MKQRRYSHSGSFVVERVDPQTLRREWELGVGWDWRTVKEAATELALRNPGHLIHLRSEDDAELDVVFAAAGVETSQRDFLIVWVTGDPETYRRQRMVEQADAVAEWVRDRAKRWAAAHDGMGKALTNTGNRTDIERLLADEAVTFVAEIGSLLPAWQATGRPVAGEAAA